MTLSKCQQDMKLVTDATHPKIKGKDSQGSGC